MEASLLNDESGFIQLGMEEETFFYSAFNDMEPNPSSWNTFPTEADPFAKYKFMSVSFELGKDLRQINRQTYSLLDWLGDVGGLLEALFAIGDFIIGPFASYALKAKIVSMMVRFKRSSNDQTL